MQAVIVSLLSGLLVMQTPAGARKSDRERAGMIGNVRSVLMEIATLSTVNNQTVEGKRFGTAVTRYDEQGNVIETVRYDGSLIIARDVFSYDAGGNYTRKQYLAQKADPAATAPPPAPVPAVSRCTVKYDAEGNLTEETCSSADGKTQTRTEYKRDKAGHRLETIKYDARSKATSRCVETLGTHGQAVEEDCQYDGPPAITSRVKRTYAYEFDATGNWVKRYGSSWQGDHDKLTFIGKDVVYRTISYDASKDVRPDDGGRLVDSFPPGPLIIRKSGGVLQQSATRKALPTYPPEARAAGIAGTVIVEVVVDEQGKVASARALSGPAELRAASEEAARGWQFRPTSLSNVPVKVIGTITFNFNR